MMNQRIVIGLLALSLSASVLLTSGCATTSEGQSVGGGALAGAVLGGILGGRRGAAIGAAVGAVAGFAVHRAQTRQLRDAAQTRRRYGYSSNKGFQMRMDKASVHPTRVSQGGEVTGRMVYATLGTDGSRKVEESRVLKKDGKVVAKLQKEWVKRADGTWENKLAFNVPASAPAGTYTLTQQIRSGGQTLSNNTQFKVKQRVSAVDEEKGLQALRLAFLSAQ